MATPEQPIVKLTSDETEPKKSPIQFGKTDFDKGPRPPKILPPLEGTKITEAGKLDLQKTSLPAALSPYAQLLNLKDGFHTPQGWTQIVQQNVARMLDAQQAGTATKEELGDDFLPIAWKETYQMQTKGPFGETLPEGAQGWQPDGKPDFGGGFAGVQKLALYNLWEKPRGDFDFLAEVGETFDDFSAKATALVTDPRFFKPGVDPTKAGIGDIQIQDWKFAAGAAKEFAGAALGAAFQTLKDFFTTAEDNSTALGFFSKFVGASADLILGGLEESGKHIEKEYLGPSVIAADEVLRKGLDAGTVPAGEAAWLEKFRKGGAFSALAPIVMVHRLAVQGLLDERGYVGYARVLLGIDEGSGPYVDLQEFRDLRRDERLRDAAHMAYTVWYDPATKAEFDRKLQSGVDPRLLAMELENPGAEMLGRAIWDPLNLLDLFQVGSIISRTSRLKKNTAMYASIPDNVADALKGMESATEATSAAASRKLLDEIGAMIDDMQSGITERAGTRGLVGTGGMTAGHKRADLGQRANNFMGAMISASAHKPDVANTVFEGLVLIQDAKTRPMGLAKLTQAIRESDGALEAKHLMSPAANETGYLLRTILTDADGNFNPNVIIDLLEEAGDNPAKLAGILDAKLNDSLQQMFPNVQEQVALFDKYRELDGEAAAEFLAKNPLANRDPGRFYRALGKADGALQPFYQRMGDIQSRLFMGTPPASIRYRANNRWGNFVPTLIDIDPRVSFKGLLGGADRFIKSMGPTASLDNISRQLGGTINEGALRALGPAGSFRGGEALEEGAGLLDRFTSAGLRGAQSDEAASAAHVSSKSINQTMGNYAKAERRIMRDELAGLSKEQQDLLYSVFRDGTGEGGALYSPRAASAALREKDGYDVARELAFLDDDAVSELKSLGLYDESRRIAREVGPQDEIVRQIDELVEDRRQLGRTVDNETAVNALDDTTGLGVGGPENQVAASIDDTITRQLGDVEADMFRRRRNANREVDFLYKEALYGESGWQRRAINKITSEAVVAAKENNWTGEQAVEAVEAALDGIDLKVNSKIETATRATFSLADEFNTRTWAISDGSKGRRADLPADRKYMRLAWEEHSAAAKNLGLPGLGPVPDDLTAKGLRNAIWQHETSGYHQVQQARFTKLKDENVIMYRAQANRYATASGESSIFSQEVINAESMYTRAAMLDEARLVDGRMVLDYSADVDGISDIIKSIGGHIDLDVNPEVHVGLIERIDPVTGETGLGLASIDPKPGGGATITITDELLNQDLPKIKESLAHEISHLFEDTDEGLQILDNLYDGDFEEFVRDILYREGFRVHTPGVTPPSQEKKEAIAIMMGNNPDIRNAIRTIGDLEETGRGARTVDDVPDFGQLAPFGKTSEEEVAGVLRGDRPFAFFGGQGFGALPDTLPAGVEVQRNLVNFGGNDVHLVFRPEARGSVENVISELRRIDKIEEPIERGSELGRLFGYSEADVRAWRRNFAGPEPRGGEFRLPVGSVMDDAAPTGFRAAHETQAAARDAGDRLIAGIIENWGRRGPTGALSPEVENILSAWEKNARGRRTTARLVAAGVADDTRDFILHNYPRRYGLDLVAGYIWPYQFWHSRTYMRWMKRLMLHPGLAQAYADYRANLEKRHAGMPPWWRRNINITELLGLDVDTPLWFNLEQTLNPLNGLTGVDFDDPKKRLDMWSNTVDDLNKFGPSVWMPYQVALGLKYHLDGEFEASSRWFGRFWSPTGAIRDFTALFDPEGLGVELDPFIHIFSGGIGPYERDRVGRALTALQQQGEDPASVIDAANAQDGPIWDRARALAINTRSPNLLTIAAPFFLGGGFKPRTNEDAMIDMFYAEMFSVIRQKEDLTPDEYRQKWNDLERRYPFMDTLLLAKKSGPERDEALAWNVLDRIPPGMRDDMAEMVGIDEDILQAFYDNNSNIDEMTEAERNLFMGAILELGAILDVPDNATKAEWEASKALYGEMQELGKTLYGKDIWEKTDTFFGLWDPENPDAGDAYLKANPLVEQALDWQTRVIQITPLLGAYYTSAERIRKFYKREMYDTAEIMFGEDIWDHLAVQGALFDMGERKAAFEYRDDHPQLKAYSEFRDSQLPIIEERVNRLAELLPGAKGPVFRNPEDAPQEIPDAPPSPTKQDWINAQILSYAKGVKQDSPDLSKIEEIIIGVADQQFPGTKGPAAQYYSVVDDNPEKAADLLLKNSALGARILWEVQALEAFRETLLGNVANAASPLSPEQVFNPEVIKAVVGESAYALALDTALDGEDLPDVVRVRLDQAAQAMGLNGYQDILALLSQ